MELTIAGMNHTKLNGVSIHWKRGDGTDIMELPVDSSAFFGVNSLETGGWN